MPEPDIRYRTIETFAGLFALIQDATGALSTTFPALANSGGLPPRARRDPKLLPKLVRRLERYFAGEAVDFGDVAAPVGPRFIRRCWRACQAIPRGETRSYAELARLAGSGRAARAAGQAMRRNHLPVIIPCHRVVASGGGLGGFNGSWSPDAPSLALKRALLEMEGALPAGRWRR